LEVRGTLQRRDGLPAHGRQDEEVAIRSGYDAISRKSPVYGASLGNRTEHGLFSNAENLYQADKLGIEGPMPLGGLSQRHANDLAAMFSNQ